MREKIKKSNNKRQKNYKNIPMCCRLPMGIKRKNYPFGRKSKPTITYICHRCGKTK